MTFQSGSPVKVDHFPLVGILGGGQLGRMLALAAIRMGLRVRTLAPKNDGPADGLGDTIFSDWNDSDNLLDFADGCDVVTVESEWAPADRLAEAFPSARIFPTPETLRLIRDKGLQKQTLLNAGIPMPEFRRCPDLDAAHAAVEAFGLPVLLKRFRGSYDGYGNATLKHIEDLPRVWKRLADHDGLLVERFAPFKRELAVMVARRPDGEHVEYPVVESVQRDHRCHMVIAPARIEPGVAERAREIARSAVEAVGAVGVVGVELFEMEYGEILYNEMAPRPHNTGHYTIEACHTSQFENHLRAILGWPLGEASLQVPAAVMVNLIGERDGVAAPEGLTRALDVSGAAVHVYGKTDVRNKRKMGHVTVTGNDVGSLISRAEEAAGLIRL
jgi:5-(carboxyamino)imidazole ribonucleotide synthase